MKMNSGGFFNVLRTHKDVSYYIFHFTEIGGRSEPLRGEKGKDYETLRSLYRYWQEKGRLSQKQINYVINLINKLVNRSY